jgi:outer membrane protein OmpA-like peptidoglycan-associated protein
MNMTRNFAVFAIATLAGCASREIAKAPIDSAASPPAEILKLDQDLNRGLAEHYDILANNDFTSAQKELDRAKRQLSKGEDQGKILDSVAYGRGYFERAKASSELLQPRMKAILDARTAALSANVRAFPALAAGFKAHDDDVRAEIKNIVNGRTTPARWATLQNGYLNLELSAIQGSKLADARARYDFAMKNGAKKNTPKLMARADRDIRAAANVIAVSRHDEDSIKPAVQKATDSAILLNEVLSMTKQPSGVINEDAAFAMVRQAHNIHDLNSKLSSASETATQSESELEQQKQQFAAAGQVLGLNRAMEDARRKFTSEEAEVYRQGDKLLIRLKAMEFPSGRSDLPEKSLPLLSKVKAITDELNPSRITVEGHTDSTGQAKSNLTLSQDRADSVATYLETTGVDSDKIEAVGRGDKKPIAPNKARQGRAQNRRVDIIITPSVQSM